MQNIIRRLAALGLAAALMLTALPALAEDGAAEPAPAEGQPREYTAEELEEIRQAEELAELLEEPQTDPGEAVERTEETEESIPADDRNAENFLPVPDENGEYREEATLHRYAASALQGIDVSQWQGEINWEAARGSIGFAILRCGYGLNLTEQDDRYWYRNANECQRLGIPFGVYLFSYATSTAQARSEAEHALRLVRGYNLSYPIYLDLEASRIAALGNDTVAAIAKTFCDTVSAAGYRVGIYASRNWWNTKLTDGVFRTPGWSRWIAHWTSGADYSGDYNMWQYGGRAVPGISGSVDADVYYGGGNAPPPVQTVHTRPVSNGLYKIVTAGGIPLTGNAETPIALRWDGNSAACSLMNMETGRFLIIRDNVMQWAPSNCEEGVALWNLDQITGGYRLTHSMVARSLSELSGSIALDTPGKQGQTIVLKNLGDQGPDLDDGAYTLTLAGTDKALAVHNGMADRGEELVYTPVINDEPGQRFAISALGENVYTVQALCSDYYMNIAGKECENGSPVVQWSWGSTDSGNLNQLWYLQENAQGQLRFISVYNGLVLGAANDGGQAAVYGINHEKAGWFTPATVFERTIDDGIYTINSAALPGRAVDVEAHLNQNGRDIILGNAGAATAWQQFRITYMGAGLYTISSYASELESTDTVSAARNVTVYEDRPVQKNKVVLYSPNDKPGQRWYIKDAGDGTYYLVSRCGGLYIGEPDGEGSVTLRVWLKNDRQIMRFRLDDVAGDVNNDGRRDLADLLLLASLVRSGEPLTAGQQACADLNGDGSVTAADVQALRDKLMA